MCLVTLQLVVLTVRRGVARRRQIASSRPATMAAVPATSRESEMEKNRARAREWMRARAWLSLKACGVVALLVAMV